MLLHHRTEGSRMLKKNVQMKKTPTDFTHKDNIFKQIIKYINKRRQRTTFSALHCCFWVFSHSFFFFSPALALLRAHLGLTSAAGPTPIPVCVHFSGRRVRRKVHGSLWGLHSRNLLLFTNWVLIFRVLSFFFFYANC